MCDRHNEKISKQETLYVVLTRLLTYSNIYFIKEGCIDDKEAP